MNFLASLGWDACERDSDAGEIDSAMASTHTHIPTIHTPYTGRKMSFRIQMCVTEQKELMEENWLVLNTDGKVCGSASEGQNSPKVTPKDSSLSYASPQSERRKCQVRHSIHQVKNPVRLDLSLYTSESATA